jgi:hypothetical protein
VLRITSAVKASTFASLRWALQISGFIWHSAISFLKLIRLDGKTQSPKCFFLNAFLAPFRREPFNRHGVWAIYKFEMARFGIFPDLPGGSRVDFPDRLSVEELKSATLWRYDA